MYPPKLDWVDAENIQIDTVMVADKTTASAAHMTIPARTPESKPERQFDCSRHSIKNSVQYLHFLAEG